MAYLRQCLSHFIPQSYEAYEAVINALQNAQGPRA